MPGGAEGGRQCYRAARKRLIVLAAAALAAMCAIVLAPSWPAFAATFVPISGAGSSWSYPALHVWITDVAGTGMEIAYSPSGSAAGRTDFAAGQVDWAASEIPYGVQDGSNFDPPPARGYAYIPDTAGAIAFAYSDPG